MTLSTTTVTGEPRASLRERKKLATRRSLRRHALDLVAQRGFANVTVEDIAEAADVSPRTFFNYFPSKEAVLFGADPDRAASLRDRLVREAPGASALDALRIVIAEDAQAVADELRELGGDPVDWLRRMKEARADPHLRAAHAAQMALVERAATEGLAERLGADPDQDPYPALLAASGASVFRASISFWAGSGGAVPLTQLIDLAFGALADGLPENCALRHVMRRRGGQKGQPLMASATPAPGLRPAAARRGRHWQRRPAWAGPPPHPAHHRRAHARHAARRARPDDRVHRAADHRRRPAGRRAHRLGDHRVPAGHHGVHPALGQAG